MVYILIAAVTFGALAAIGTIMGKKDCPHCREKVDAKATVCPKCQRDIEINEYEDVLRKKKMGNISAIVLICGVILVAYVALPSGSSKSQRAPVTSSISHEIFRQWVVGENGLGMVVLVDESARKSEVEQLGRELVKQYSGKKFLLISIFDSRDAAIDHQHALEANYKPRLPENKYFKHFLVEIIRNDATGHNEMNWVAEGRDH